MHVASLTPVLLVAENGTKLLLGLERDPASWDNLPPVIHNKRGTLFVQGTIEALNRMQSANKFADDKGPLFSGIFFDETFTACTKCTPSQFLPFSPTVIGNAQRFPDFLRLFDVFYLNLRQFHCSAYLRTKSEAKLHLDPLFVSEGVDPMNSIVYQTALTEKPVEVPDVDVSAFKAMLSYIYADDLSGGNAIAVLYAVLIYYRFIALSD
uniref:BTB domain-containing protein n=1 Tax=Globodera pallida TaxID=36090 RepID=A0A183C6S1_GLOPA